MSQIWDRIAKLSPEKRRALEELLAREGLEPPAPEENPFTAPRSDREKRLAEIWQTVLGVPRVGVDDDFFALGGDSIHSIQIVARARQVGIELTAQEIFDHPTVARLATVARELASPSAGAGEDRPPPDDVTASGDAPLTPIQRWFFDLRLPDPDHWNQAVLLAVGPAVSAEHLGRALEHLAWHHDALRLRFATTEEGWRATVEPPETASWPLELHPLAELGERAEALQRRLSITRGPLVAAGFFGGADGEDRRLLLVAHHLAVDGVSFRILIEDLSTALGQLVRGEPLALPAKTAPWRAWAQHLSRLGAAGVGEARLEDWLAQGRPAASLPVDLPAGTNRERDAREHRVVLPAAQTEVLLRSARHARADAHEVLLAALLEGLTAWSGERAWRIDVEAHGREEAGAAEDALDVTRTVGWFTALYPARFELPGSGGPCAALRSVKRARRSAPGSPAAWGVLRYLGSAATRKRLAALPAAEVMFNYLGQVDAGLAPGGLLRPAGGLAPAQLGALFGPDGERPHQLQVVAAVLGGELELRLLSSAERYRRASLERLAAAIELALGALVTALANDDPETVDPDDFLAAGLERGELARILDPAEGLRLSAVEDIAFLSPTQAGMLYHVLGEADPQLYREQGSALLTGELDPQALARAWSAVVARHGALRTGFHWQGLRQPLQVVRRRVELSFTSEDWRGLEPAARERRLADALARDRERIGRLGEPPLMALTLARLDGDRHRLLWSIHHLVHDAWSLAVLLDEVLALYAAERTGKAPALPPALPYTELLTWQAGRTFDPEPWRRRLAGFRRRTPLPGDRGGVSGSAAATGWEHRELWLEPAATAALDQAVRHLGMTLGTWIHGAWALTLAASGRARGETLEDVVFGTVVAGRPDTLPGAERGVGLYIHTLPLRVAFAQPSVESWLEALQDQLGEVRSSCGVPLARVQELAELPRGERLFDSLVVVQNVFLDVDGRSVDGGSAAGLTITDVSAAGHPNDPLTLRVTPGARLRVELLFDSARLRASAAERVLADFQTALQGLAARPAAPLAEHLASLARQPAQPSRTGGFTVSTKHKSKPSLGSLGASPARTVSLTRREPVREGSLPRGGPLPRLFEPRQEGVDVVAWVRSERDRLERALGEYGGLLLRGFRVDTPERFEALIEALAGEALEYRERSSPRSAVAGRIYTSTDYPSDQPIFLHNENSYAHTWPLRILFFCQSEPTTGGETPIADVRAVYRRLDPDLRRRFAERGILYVRNFSDSVGLSWRTVFQTDDRAQVERECRARGYDFEWLEGGRLRTRRVGPAALRHPETGEAVWFNHGTFFHLSTLPAAIGEGLLAHLGEDLLPNQTYYGDGSPIEPETLAALRAAYEAETVSFPWRRDDVLVLDNMLVAHARAPFTGPRRILTGMARPVDASRVAAIGAER